MEDAEEEEVLADCGTEQSSADSSRPEAIVLASVLVKMQRFLPPPKEKLLVPK